MHVVLSQQSLSLDHPMAVFVLWDTGDVFGVQLCFWVSPSCCSCGFCVAQSIVHRHTWLSLIFHFVFGTDLMINIFWLSARKPLPLHNTHAHTPRAHTHAHTHAHAHAHTHAHTHTQTHTHIHTHIHTRTHDAHTRARAHTHLGT